jgi:PAS domain S-box-containing protein
MDGAGRITAVDCDAERLFGWTADDVVGGTVADVLVPHELRAAHWRGLRRVAAGGRSRLTGHTITVPALHAEGRRMAVELRIEQVATDPVRFLGTLVPAPSPASPGARRTAGTASAS